MHIFYLTCYAILKLLLKSIGEMLMIAQKIIDEVKDILVKTYNPVKIYIFGSYAWGHPTEDSDLDILVVIDHYEKDHHQTLVEGHRALVDVDVSKDLLVYSKKNSIDFQKIKHDFAIKSKIEESLFM